MQADLEKVSSDVAFTPSVKAIQERRGSRASYAKMEMRGGFKTAVTADLAAFLAQVDSAVLSTTNAAGQPYAQHRGGPKASSRSSTTGHSPLQTIAVTGSTSRSAIWRRIHARSCS